MDKKDVTLAKITKLQLLIELNVLLAQIIKIVSLVYFNAQIKLIFKWVQNLIHSFHQI